MRSLTPGAEEQQRQLPCKDGLGLEFWVWLRSFWAFLHAGSISTCVSEASVMAPAGRSHCHQAALVQGAGRRLMERIKSNHSWQCHYRVFPMDTDPCNTDGSPQQARGEDIHSGQTWDGVTRNSGGAVPPSHALGSGQTLNMATGNSGGAVPPALLLARDKCGMRLQGIQEMVCPQLCSWLRTNVEHDYKEFRRSCAPSFALGSVSDVCAGFAPSEVPVLPGCDCRTLGPRLTCSHPSTCNGNVSHHTFLPALIFTPACDFWM